MNITDVEGIGPDYAAKLVAAGITNTDTLLERGATAHGRTAIESATGISDKLILEWVNHADLMRLNGVGSEYADLLEAAGVDSPAELAHRNAANLAQTFQELVAARPETVRRVPSAETVAAWIAEAKTLDKVVTHGGEAAAPASSPAAPPVAAGSSAAHGHDHDHDHSPASSAAAPVPGPAPAPAAKAAAPAAASAPKDGSASKEPAKPTGLWARIKGMFGGG